MWLNIIISALQCFKDGQPTSEINRHRCFVVNFQEDLYETLFIGLFCLLISSWSLYLNHIDRYTFQVTVTLCDFMVISIEIFIQSIVTDISHF